jgi:ketosteroid isomerase-like protein
MGRMLCGVAVVVALLGCNIGFGTFGAAPPMRAGIVAALDSSAAGWTTLNLDKFMAIYLDSSITSYATKTGYLHGRAAIRDHYAPGFAPGKKPGALRLDSVVVDSLSPTAAYVRATYVLTDAGTTIATGPTSLLMERIRGVWYIVHDHSG